MSVTQREIHLSLPQSLCFAHVDSVSVDEAFRSQGIERELMAHIELWAAANAAADARLNVWVFNQPALRLAVIPLKEWTE